jgi:predicted ribosome quality control (RQC) complex YloA/Tae2 family protein
VAGLRRPPITAWALNQLAREAQDEVADLRQAGQELVDSQTAALGGGGSAADFEAAQRHQREAVRRLTRTARALLERAGQKATGQTVERVASSLRAASVDEEGRRLLEQGRFEDDFEGAGLLALAGLAPASPPARRPARRRGDKPAPEPKRDERAERARRREELKAARRTVRAAEQEEQAAGRALERAERDAARAREAAEEAERTAESAREALDKARNALEQARAEADRLAD